MIKKKKKRKWNIEQFRKEQNSSNPNLPVTMLSINGINIPIKR
jgi:hypothetical protein